MTEIERDELLLAMKSKLDKHDELLLAMKNQLDDISSKVNEHEKELRSISRSVAKIEVEHGSAIQALLDGQVAIFEQLDSINKRLDSDEVTLENHSSRIWKLESSLL